MLKLALKSWVAKMVATILNFGTVIVLSRNLGSGERGICAFYTVVIAMCLVFNELAAGSTTVYLQRSTSWKQIRSLAASWSFIASGLLTMIVWLAGKTGWQEWLALWLVSWLNGVVTIQYNILLGFKKYLIYNVLSVLTPFVVLTSMVLLALTRHSSPFNYLLVITAGVSLSLLAGAYFLRDCEDVQPRLPWAAVARKSFGTGLINQAGHVVSMLNSRYMYYLFPAASLGVFTNSLSLAEAMLLVPGSMGQIYYTQAVGESKKSTHLGNGFVRLLAINIALMLAICLLIQLFPGSLYTWVFGPQFEGVKSFLRVLALGSLFYSIYLLTSYWHSAQGNFKHNLLAGAGGLVINGLGIMMLQLTERLTLPNVAVLTVFASLTISLLAILLYKKEKMALMTIG
jgi:O-antigen/teichoic acid export membrane protein